MTRFAAKPIDLGRPPAWHALADKLVAEGWLYETDTHEWVLGEPHPILGGVGWEHAERGRIAWSPDGLHAWLSHPGDAPTPDDLQHHRTVGTPDSHHIEVTA